MQTGSPDRLVATGDFRTPRRDELSVLWAITKACTFSCSYCVYYKSARGASFTGHDELIGAARKLVRLGRPAYQITLYGGEPTLHPHFNELLAYFARCGAPVALRVYTNGNSALEVYQGMAAAIGAMPFGVIFSLHLEFVNFAKFKRALEVTANSGIAAGVGVMYTAARREQARQAIHELLALRSTVTFVVSITHPYAVDGAMGAGCTEDDLRFVAEAQAAFDAFTPPPGFQSPFFTRVACNLTIDRNGMQEVLGVEESLAALRTLERPSYKGMHCCSGTNVMFIEEDGAVRGGVCSSSRSLGNILTDAEVELLQRALPVQCTASACTSIENIPLPKFEDAAEAQRVAEAFNQRARVYFYGAEARRLA